MRPTWRVSLVPGSASCARSPPSGAYRHGYLLLSLGLNRSARGVQRIMPQGPGWALTVGQGSTAAGPCQILPSPLGFIHEHDEHFASRHLEVVCRRTGRSAWIGYGTSSEYVRELIGKDQERLRLRDLLLAGASSSPTAPADPAYFEGLRAQVRRPATSRARR